MNIKITSLLFMISTFISYGGTPNESQKKDILHTKALIGRILKDSKQTERFKLEIIPSKNAMDVFELEGEGENIIIRGNNAQALSRGFNWYLNKNCKTNVSWYLDEPVELPAILPKVTEKVSKQCRHERRFFLNYCTFGYTMPWWQWDDWERFIDWMALNGINMPLAITGQEAIWQKVWRKHGMTDDQIRAFFTAPGHLPWHRMANCDRWLGPLPQSYIDHQLILQKQILKRQRALGMTPILPAFAGHVPKEIKNKYKDASITPLSSYTLPEECTTYFLTPTDPLFIKIQEEFLTEQQKEFGTDHVYGADPFNEMTPPSWEPEYLASVAKTIYKGMTNVDPDAEWVQMGWMFYHDKKHWTNERIRAIVNSIPEGKMTILDYYCESVEIWRGTNAFGGAPYIWCYLGNFGGNTEMVGNMQHVADTLLKAEADPKKGKLIGIGSTLEGFSVNRTVMEWFFELAWDKDAADTKAWMKTYAASRSGKEEKVVEQAWEKIHKAVYSKKNSGCADGNILIARPRLTGVGCNYAYIYNKDVDVALLGEGLEDLLKASPETLKLNRYQYDIVNVTRQFITLSSLKLRDKMALAYYQGDKEEFEKYSTRFLTALADLDRLLQTRSEFLIGKWVNEARAFGKTKAESDLYEVSARVLVTTWGQQGSFLTDYAHRERAGLVKDYYMKRWQVFIDQLKPTVGTNQVLDLKKLDQKMTAIEWKWANSHNPYSGETKGDPVAIARELCPKYQTYYAEKMPKETVIAKWRFDEKATPPTNKTWDITKLLTKKGNFLIQARYFGGQQTLDVSALTLITPDGEKKLTGKQGSFILDIQEIKKGFNYRIKVTFKPSGIKEAHVSIGRLILLTL